jgi:hypothetical protein
MYIGEIMPQLVLLTGLLVAGVSLFLMARPAAMAGLLDRVFGSAWLYGAALLRLLLGAALIGSADTVRYPPVVETLGWLFVVGGLALVALPLPLLRRLAGWFGRLSSAATRAWLSVAFLIGLFLVYVGLA